MPQGRGTQELSSPKIEWLVDRRQEPPRSSRTQSRCQTHAPPGRSDSRPADSPDGPEGEPRGAPRDRSGTGVPGHSPAGDRRGPGAVARAVRARSSWSGGSPRLSGRREQCWVIEGDERTSGAAADWVPQPPSAMSESKWAGGKREASAHRCPHPPGPRGL